MGFYYYDYTYFLFMAPALLISLAAQIGVHATFRKYSQITNRRFLTGEGAAQRVLQYGGVMNVSIQRVGGSLTDFFNPHNQTIALSDSVFGLATVSAVGVAAHEAGHAIQHAKGYLPIKIRNALVPAVNLSSNLAMPLVVLGLLLPVKYDFVVFIGMGLYGFAVLFSLVTLPVEFNASRRAIRALSETGALDPDELKGAKRVLQAAAMTYVASTLTALLSFFRLVLIAGNRRGRE
ncbi:MAG: zinc metallopeptidase [Clostridiales bacterium]|nr:zinc metallopeptidase [Clostridiales bacterium]